MIRASVYRPATTESVPPLSPNLSLLRGESARRRIRVGAPDKPSTHEQVHRTPNPQLLTPSSQLPAPRYSPLTPDSSLKSLARRDEAYDTWIPPPGSRVALPAAPPAFLYWGLRDAVHR